MPITCLMGKFGNGESTGGSTGFDVGFRQSFSPLRFVSEQGDELVRRSEETFAQVWWNDGLDGFELFAGITACVDFGGRQVAVSEPQGHLADVLCCVQHDHRGGCASKRAGTLACSAVEGTADWPLRRVV
jgi:hypothetical protein